jgi:lipoprotein-releasing system ATP-binding protein
MVRFIVWLFLFGSLVCKVLYVSLLAVNPASNSFSSALALEVVNLKHSFITDAGTLEVLKGLSFSLAASRVLAIVGPSGSGKSTLLHLLGGLETPTSGEIRWGSASLAGASQEVLASRRAQEVGFVFQHHYLLEDLTTLENVGLPGLIASTPNDARAAQLLKRVGLDDRANFFPRALSGGERQRVAIARALLTKPRLILADEPTGSLDRANADLVFAMLVELARLENTAVVVVTHDESLVSRVDDVIRLQDGRIV